MPDTAVEPVQRVIDTDWRQIVASLQLSGLTRTLAQHCELRHLGESECVLRLAPMHAHLQMKPAPDKLQQSLCDYFGRPMILRFELAQNETDTPAAVAGREKQLRQEAALASIEQDLFVRDVMSSLDASLVESSIKPIA
jgi:DNA polymerase-3 subunit gamma/tau